jgi:hypothetical protein
MRTIAAFHKTPEGQKMLDKMPQLMKKQAEIGSELARARQGELQSMLAARAKELEKTPGQK